MSEIKPGQRVGRPVPGESGLRQGIVMAVTAEGARVRFDDGGRRWVPLLDLVPLPAQ